MWHKVAKIAIVPGQRHPPLLFTTGRSYVLPVCTGTVHNYIEDGAEGGDKIK